ncbi:hypothetical protein VMCG_04848 [Cytospora schulzeri]|uniref:F-box domain-containing protein n=1 Tax=Cytospora schulzeri TaxID=448051 RepID=A0A423WN83_9PEZI|nr:hypothetical protein VMCG_04848 [Valsa malicola]
MASKQDNSSTTESGLSLLGLAPEIVEHIIKYAPKKDLPSIRLANKELDKHAVSQLFKEVFLSPSEEHIGTYTSISEHERLRRLPRSAIIHSQPDINMGGVPCSRKYEDQSEEYEDAIAALGKFPNIDSLEIGFTPECLGDRDNSWYEDVEETISERKMMFEWIFEAIKDRAANPDNRTIRKLTIINLQNCPIPDFTRSDLFRDVMSQVEELHLELTQEYNEAGPDHDYTRVELQTFPGYLVSDWLEPFSGNLKALSIYSRTDNWGPFPGYFRPSGLSLPKLETLSLGYYTLAHDDDLSWVLDIKSLKQLVLHNCMILSRARFDPENLELWKPRTEDWVAVPEEKEPDALDNWPAYAYHGKWSEFFERIAGGLPNLVDFRFDKNSTWHDPRYSVKNRNVCGARVFPERYLVFDNGILPTHWPEAEENGSIYSWTEGRFPNFHEERREEDQRGMDELLEACRRRIT